MILHSDKPARPDYGDFEKFTEFMRKLISVPHSEIKARLEAEKAAKRLTPQKADFHTFAIDCNCPVTALSA